MGGWILVESSRKFSLSREGFLISGFTMASLRALGIENSINDLMVGRSTGSMAFTREVGNGSRAQDFEFPPAIIFSNLSSEIWVKDSIFGTKHGLSTSPNSAEC